LLVAVLKLNVSDEGGNQGCHQRPSLAISGHPRPSEAHRTYGEVRKTGAPRTSRGGTSRQPTSCTSITYGRISGRR
jgi:hypothetical protein